MTSTHLPAPLSSTSKYTFDPVLDQIYEISISPNDKTQYFGRKKRLRLFMSTTQRFLKEALDKHNIEYKLYLDISTNNVNIRANEGLPRLHYHGWVKFRDDKALGSFYLHSIYKLSRWSNITFNNYRDTESEPLWEDYCLKNLLIVKGMSKLEKCPVSLSPSTPRIMVDAKPNEFQFMY